MLAVEDLQKLLADLIGARPYCRSASARGIAPARHADRQIRPSLCCRAAAPCRCAASCKSPRKTPSRHHMDEVVVAGHVLAQQDQMAVPFAVDIAALVSANAARDRPRSRSPDGCPSPCRRGKSRSRRTSRRGRSARTRSARDSATRSTSCSMRHAPSSRLYSLCTCRWANGTI